MLTQRDHYGKWSDHWPKFVILPGRKHGDREYPDLLVSPKRDLFGRVVGYGNSTHAWVQHVGPNNILETCTDPATTITLRQFVDYVNMMRSDKVYDEDGKLVNKEVCEQILEENLGSLTGEFINANIIYRQGSWPFRRRETHLQTWEIRENTKRFDVGKVFVITSELSQIETKLTGYLARPESIDLDEWLERATPEGLPPKKIRSGNLTYHPPIGFGSTILFRGRSGGRYNLLDCGVDHMTQGNFIGLRKVMLKP